MLETDGQWTEKNAILWEKPAVGGDDSCYWDVELLSQITRSEKNNSKQEQLISLPFQSVFFLTAFLANIIRSNIRIHLQLSSSQLGNAKLVVGIPIAVAIPEGPFLPIAIMALHALNQPFRHGAEGMVYYCVLIPIPPREGKDRIRHMLNDIRPMMVLCQNGRDIDYLRNILTFLDKEESSLTTEGLLRSQSTELVDISHFCSDAAMCYRKETMTMIRKILREDGESSGMPLQQLLEKCTTCLSELEVKSEPPSEKIEETHHGNRISHIVYTSGTTGIPKGCISSIRSLQHYISCKNDAHGINDNSIVLLASSLSFDPCLSDILATFQARGTLGIARRQDLNNHLSWVVQSLGITHVLCTPTLWSNIDTTTSVTVSASTTNALQQHTVDDDFFSELQVVALGGEVIPKHVVQRWACKRSSNDASYQNCASNEKRKCRLYATYGVTEACVYQTMGEIWNENNDEDNNSNNDSNRGQNVGQPFDGLEIRICSKIHQEKLVDVDHVGLVGEIVLCGAQVDELSSYLRRPDSATKFVKEPPSDLGKTLNRYYYRTGDKGFVDPETSNLHILGRIDGEHGMVKINGIRVELAEIEAAIIDNNRQQSLPPIVRDAAVVARKAKDDGAVDSSNTGRELHAFCVLSRECLLELGIRIDEDYFSCGKGMLCTCAPLLTLLQSRCREKVTSGLIPSAFILLPRVPLSPTGKRNVSAFPSLSQCIPSEALLMDEDKTLSRPLREYGSSGAIVAEQIIDCLNLQPCQQSMLTPASSFSILGGDSLAATRVVRSLYAFHHNVRNSRFLGGEYGTLDGPFSTRYLLASKNLGHYVDWLDRNELCRTKKRRSTDLEEGGIETIENRTNVNGYENATTGAVNPPSDLFHRTKYEEKNSQQLYDALLQAVTRGMPHVAMALLDIDADPNFGDHGGRLGKVSGRNNRKGLFRSGPLHLACRQGNSVLVKRLLARGAKFNSPDASGLFPLHLAASGRGQGGKGSQLKEDEDDRRRLECVKLLLEAGAPLVMKDGNKQTVIHCAARSGHCELLQDAIRMWKEMRGLDGLDWRDRWFRTPVHWAILNGRVKALHILLDMGCDPHPPKNTRKNNSTSAAVESPIELCDRLYGTSEGIGLEISRRLNTVV